MRIAFATLGCKINQVETDMLRRDCEDRGNTVVPFNAEADVYVINTCSVTAKSDYQCRQAIRSAVRRSQGAKVVVTGCYAELRPDDLKQIEGVGLVVGTRDKKKIPEFLFEKWPVLPDRNEIILHNQAVQAVRSRTRGFLKIQDGCDSNCAYCVVPLARGRSRSVLPEEVMNEFGRLVREGCPEVVLSGIHIGKYGMDLVPKIDLAVLVKQLVSLQGSTRLRLSSIEPGEITQELIGLLGKTLCRHLHIPLQSGDDAILASMNRSYTSAFYRDLLEHISGQVPGIALGADVMVGFPGEGEQEFQNTMHLVEQTPLTHLHVFSYSRRPGTPAASMKGQVPEDGKKARSEALHSLAREKNLNFRRKLVGQHLEVVVEGTRDKNMGLLAGLTDNYIRVHISGAKNELIGKRVVVRITDVKEQENFADLE